MDLSVIPTDVLQYNVFQFLTYDVLALTNKKYWLNYYKIRLDKFKKNVSYNRFLIRNDYGFIYKYFVDNTMDILTKNKKFKFQNKYFTRNIDLSLYLINKYNSSKCNFIIKKIMKQHKIIFKKIKTNKHIWTN